MADEQDLLRASRCSPPAAPPTAGRGAYVEPPEPYGNDEEYEPGSMSYVRVGTACGLNVRQVRRVEGLAIQKLRAYLEPWIDDPPS
jgi:hypothetical protein